jgi:hypothetical protein
MKKKKTRLTFNKPNKKNIVGYLVKKANNPKKTTIQKNKPGDAKRIVGWIKKDS